MSTTTLFFVKQLGSISDHLNIEEIFINFWIKEANFTFLELKLFIHVYLSTPDLSLKSTEHLLASHFKKITNMYILVIFGDNKIFIKEIIFLFAIFDVIHLTNIFSDGRKMLAGLWVVERGLTISVPNEVYLTIGVRFEPCFWNSKLDSEHMSAIRWPKFVSNFWYLIEEGAMILLLDDLLQVKPANIFLDLDVEMFFVLRLLAVPQPLFVPVGLDIGDLIAGSLPQQVGADPSQSVVEIFVQS